jgi:hypothetical protein
LIQERVIQGQSSTPRRRQSVAHGQDASPGLRARQAAGECLRLCLCGRWDPPALDGVRALVRQGEVDWDAFLRTAREEGVAPLACFPACGQGLLPAEVEDSLRMAYYHTLARNLVTFRELEAVLRCLDGVGVPAILLKGAALAEVVYGDPGLRPMCDLDLLVRRANLPAALCALEGLGYRVAHEELRPGHMLRFRNELALVRPGEGGAVIELHWELLGPLHYQRAVPAGWFWQTALPMGPDGGLASVLGPEAQLLHLCGHILQHGGLEKARWLWLHDVAEVVALYHDRLDWDEVIARAQAYDLVLALRIVLGEVRETWRAPVPGQVLQRLQALAPSAQEARAYARLTTAPGVVRCVQDALASVPDWRARIRLLWPYFLPSARYVRHRYRVAHPLLVPLYYGYRWLGNLRVLLGYAVGRLQGEGPRDGNVR